MVQTPVPIPQEKKPEKKEVTEVQVQVQLPDGSRVTVAAQPQQTLMFLHNHLIEQGKMTKKDSYSFVEPPRREFKLECWKTTSFLSAGLIPRCALKIVLSSQKGNVIKGTGIVQNHGASSPLPNPVMPFGNNEDEEY